MQLEIEPTTIDPRHRSGRSAEQLAERHLLERGLKLVTRNFRCRRGELDLVCRDAGVLVIVEVRQRMRDGYGGPLASIGRVKQARLRRAAAYFLLQNRCWNHLPVRFDVVTVLGAPEAEHELRWLPNAFQ